MKLSNFQKVKSFNKILTRFKVSENKNLRGVDHFHVLVVILIQLRKHQFNKRVKMDYLVQLQIYFNHHIHSKENKDNSINHKVLIKI